MKTICSFCKTQYDLSKLPTRPVQCIVCSNTWTVPPVMRKNNILVLIASVCALIAASIFAFVIVTKKKIQDVKKFPIIVQLSNIRTVTDAFDEKHFVVTGKVINQSLEMYGVSNLLIISLDDKGSIIARQKFMAPATILESGESVEFTHTLSTPIKDVKKITIELTD